MTVFIITYRNGQMRKFNFDERDRSHLKVFIYVRLIQWYHDRSWLAWWQGANMPSLKWPYMMVFICCNVIRDQDGCCLCNLVFFWDLSGAGYVEAGFNRNSNGYQLKPVEISTVDLRNHLMYAAYKFSGNNSSLTTTVRVRTLSWIQRVASAFGV